MLTSRIEISRQTGESLEPEDIFASATDQLFPDTFRAFHGDGNSQVRYDSAAFGTLRLSVTDPTDEQERSKFAHAVWNASILLCEMIGSWITTSSTGTGVEEKEAAEAAGAAVKEAIMNKEENTHTSINLKRPIHEVCCLAGERVLELGAGTGLGGIASALGGAEEVRIAASRMRRASRIQDLLGLKTHAHLIQVFITDYPLPQILQNISMNVSENVPGNRRAQVKVTGHKWGEFNDSFAEQHIQHFSCIIAADTLWLRSQHSNLCHSISHFLANSSDARAIIVAGFHTGREVVASFFGEISLLSLNLMIDELWETDVENRTRPWMGGDFVEPLGERSKWHVVAIIKRRSV